MLDTVCKGKVNLAALIGVVRGAVWLPGDEGYDAARASWNLTVDHRPEVVVVASSEADVVAAVKFAHEHGLPVCVQATGHGQPRCCTEGMLLNVSELNHVSIDAQGQMATTGGGAMWDAVIEKSVAESLVPISGSSPNVGVVGYTIGGGFGLLSRKYGLASDSVVSMRLVTSEGDVKEVSQTSNPDLYWAILGGGGAYGVVTEITMKLYPHGELFGGSVMFDASLSETVYATYVEWTKGVPDEVGSAITMVTYPPAPFVPEFLHGRSMLVFSATAIGSPAQAEEWLAPIRGMAGAEFDSFHPMSFADSAKVFNDPVDPLPACGRGAILKDMDAEGLATMLRAIGPAPQSPNMMIQFRHIGGAVNRPSKNATGDRRRGKYIVYFLGIPMGPATPDMMAAHAENAFSEMAPYILSRGPLNWLGEARVKQAEIRDVFHEEEYLRLCEIKEAVDPQNRFRFAGVGVRG